MADFFDAQKTIGYLRKAQNEDGSYPSLKPDPVSSMYFLGILYELDEKPKHETTRNWVLSLQTDHRGFGETPGENSWDYTTFWGSQMHKFLKAKPKFEKEFINFVRAHQNSDGGFGNTINSPSNLFSTFYWGASLLGLGYRPVSKKGLADFLSQRLNYFRGFYLGILYKIIYILKKLNSKIKSRDKIVLYVSDLIKQSRYFANNVEFLYYGISILNLLGKKVSLSDLKFDSTSPASAYFSVKLMKLANFPITEGLKNRITEYCYSHELRRGGFFDEKSKGCHSAYCCINGLKLFGENPKHKEKTIEWFISCQSFDGGFGYQPNFPSNEKATYWTIDSLKLLGALRLVDKKRLVEYLNRLAANINPYLSYYLVSVYELIDVVPQNWQKIINGLLRFKNKDGGFGAVEDVPSQMYEAFRTTNAIAGMEKILDRNQICHENWLNTIKGDISAWIFSCENIKGGFSWVPNEIPYIQPTYHALTVLGILNIKISNPGKHISWMLQFLKEDGGFNGGIKGTPSDVHFTFWALKSLEILGGLVGHQKSI